ncbi:MAG TPA: hypothetical protein VL651_09965, partial [Bacteroidia bacterium]|nr:hypothetical protein [Bacteroidia bacterium]
MKTFVAVFFLIGCSLHAQQVTKKRGKETVNVSGGTAVGKVRHHQKTGEWKYYDAKGEVYETVVFKNDLANGVCVVYYTGTSVIQSTGKYVNGARQGIWEQYYPSGKDYRKSSYLNDTLDGLQQTWYENGKIELKEFYMDGQLVYHWMWYDNGGPEEVQYYAAGKPTGTWKYWKNPGTTGDTCVATTSENANGHLNGFERQYDHGQLIGETEYLNDMIIGLKKKWAPNGKLISIESYSMGVMDGLSTYYSDGVRIETDNYRNGLKNGSCDLYDFYGRRTRHEYFSTGQVDTTYSYYANGKISSSRIYKRYVGIAGNEEYSDYMQFDSSGVKLLKGQYH